MKKKLLAWFVAFVMAAGLLPGTAWASATDFVIKNGILVEYKGPGGDVVIPDNVTAIGDEAFESCTALTGVTIPYGVTAIGDNAFAWCGNLASVNIPIGVYTIGSGAFAGTALTSVAIPPSVTLIDDGTFDFCEFLTSVTIPASVTSIGVRAFDNCDSLTDVYYSGGRDQWQHIFIASRNDPLYGAKIHYNSPLSFSGTWGDNITWSVSGDTLTIQGTGAMKDVGTHGGLDMPWAINGVELHTLIIESGVTTIGDYAFYLFFDALTSVTIPASVTSIGFDAFEGCDRLTDVYYGGSESQWKQISTFSTNAPLHRATIHYSGTGAGAPAPAVVLSPQKLTVDGRNVDCEKYNIDGSNYFKLRDLAYLLNGTGSQFGVGFDAASSTVSIVTGAAYTPIGTELTAGVNNSGTAKLTSQTILINGVKRGDLTVYNIGGSNFFQLRELGRALGFEVGYDALSNTAIVRSTQK